MKVRGYPTPRERPTTPTPAAPIFYPQAAGLSPAVPVTTTFADVAVFRPEADAVILSSGQDGAGTVHTIVEFELLTDSRSRIGSVMLASGVTETVYTRAGIVRARTLFAGVTVTAAATALYRR